MYRFLPSKGALVLACLLYLALSLAGALFMPWPLFEGTAGLCFPSPGGWGLTPLFSWCAGVMLTAACALALGALVARFNMAAASSSLLYITVFLTAQAANPWVAARLGSSVIVCLVTLVCTHILFAQYDRKNAAQGMFIIFSLLGWGATIQYAFVLLMPIFLLGAVFLGVLRLRETAAALLGAVAPFWIVFGSGLAPLSALHWPDLTNLMTLLGTPQHLFMLLLTEGVTALFFLFLWMGNALRQEAQVVQMRACNSFINLLGASMVWFMLFDTSNVLAYSSVLCVCLGVHAARHYRLTRSRPAAAATTLLILLILLANGCLSIAIG